MTAPRRDNPSPHSQAGYRVRFEWGESGVRHLAPGSDVVVLVDVLRFTTSVAVAVARGAEVFPFRYHAREAASFARSVHARLAGERGCALSLSPASLLGLEPGARIVLPSPNGSTCTLVASELAPVVMAGSLRNASAVAAFLTNRWKGAVITVIACGERWPDGQLRPALEDILGAGAVLAQLTEQALSPEALAAAGLFQALQEKLAPVLRSCASGRELALKGLAHDVKLAAELDASPSVPVVRNGAYTGAENPA